ncbi:ARPP-1 family domain-containing protein [Acidobacteriota bacterium]
MAEAALKEMLKSARVSTDSVRIKNLVVVGISHDYPSTSKYVTLHEALETGQFEVTEIDPDGSVPDVTIENRLDSDVLLIAGDMLIGAKQNRVVNVSILAAAKQKIQVPVSCVEQGRWHYTSSGFNRSDSTSHARMRRKLHEMSHDSYLREARPRTDQEQVWEEVDQKLEEMGSASNTSDLSQIFADHGLSPEEMEDGLHAIEGCQGAAFIYGDNINIEIFDKPGSLKACWNKILESHAIDAARCSEPSLEQVKEVARLLESALKSEKDTFDSPGKGEDMRWKTSEQSGSALMVEEMPVHVAIFTSEGEA